MAQVIDIVGNTPLIALKKLNKNDFDFSKGYFEEDDTWYITRKI